MIDLFKEDNVRFNQNKLQHENINGWHDDTYSKCIKNIANYKVYALHFNCALPYSYYRIVDTRTGIVYRTPEYHYNLDKVRNELFEQLEKGIENS